MRHIALIAVTLLCSCATISHEYLLNPTEVSGDASYGYSKDNPIKVGGIEHERGSRNARSYLSHLRLSGRDPATIVQVGSCCPFETGNSPTGKGSIDVYRLTFESPSDTIVLYLDTYEYDLPMAPAGFTGSMDGSSSGR